MTMEMVGTLLSERRLSFRQAAEREGRSYRTILQWADVGVRGVQLEAFRQGGRRFTTIEALERFAERCTLGANIETTSEAKQRKARAEAAMARIALLRRPTRRRASG